MDRQSNQHGARADDALKRDTRALVQGNRGSRVEDWRDPEPSGDDEPVVDRGAGTVLDGPAPRAPSRAEADERAELAGQLGRAIFPADKDALLRHLEDTHADDTARRQIAALSDSLVFDNVEEVWEALGHRRATRGH
jgi:hypothetical protein